MWQSFRLLVRDFGNQFGTVRVWVTDRVIVASLAPQKGLEAG